MVATLHGRIQTRIFVLLVIGGLWTLVITPWLPRVTRDHLGTAYHGTYAVLATVIVLGIAWEFIYHGLQQFRWEKDWPTLFGLVTAVNEGLLVWLFVKQGWIPTDVPPISGRMFAVDFVTTWLVCWTAINGPMRVPFVRWRFRGGKVFG